MTASVVIATVIVAAGVVAVVVATASAVATLLLLDTAVDAIVMVSLCELHQVLIAAPLKCNDVLPDSRRNYRFRSAANLVGSYSSLRPSRMRFKKHTFIKLSRVCSSLSRCWNTPVRYSSGS